MPGEGVVAIGATFDKTNVDAGLGSTQEMVKASMEGISASITEANAKSKAAWKGLSDEVKASAATMNAEALKVAESSKAVAAAQGDVRRAWTLSKDAAIPLEQSMGTLAAAQVRLTEAQAAQVAASRQQAAVIAEAAEEEALSQNIVVRAFQKMALNVRESLESVQEKVIETAETSGVEAEGISAGFGGLSKLLGAGLAVGFAANYIDGLAKINVELEHLATKSGISITSLAGLQQILKEAGGDFEAVATGLVRMESNVEKLSEGKGAPAGLADAFTHLGLKLEDVRRAKPEELLQMIATGMANSADANIRANSAITIFGRGGQALIPVLREQGELLTANMEKTGKLTGITDQSAEAARRWTQDVARLSAQFRSVMIPVMEHAEDVIRGIASVFEVAAAILVSAFEGVATAIVAMFAPLYRFGILMKDIFTGNWTALRDDAERERTAFVDTWKTGFAEIKANWAEVAHTFAGNTELPPMPDTADSEGGGFTPPVKKGRRNAAFEADKQQLDEQKLDHRVNLEDEIEFWKEKLAAAKKGSDEYKAIVATLAGLMQKEDRKPKIAPGSIETESPSLPRAQAEFEAAMEKEVKATETAIKEEMTAYRDQAEEKIRLAHEDYVDVEKNANFEVQMGRMTSQQRIAVLRQAASQENQIRQTQSKFIEMLDSNDVKRYEADLKKEEQDTRDFTRQMRQLFQQLTLEIQDSWKKGFDKMTAQFNTDVAQWVTTGKGFEQSMAKMMDGIAENFVKNLLKMMEQEALAAIQHKALMSQKIIADAKAAAADAYQWAASWGGPVAGVIAAAAAFAGVMAFDSFAAGGVVQGGGGMAVPILAHAGERVLSPAQTANFEKMVSNSSSSSSTVNHTTHLTQNMNGYDKAGMKAALREHADDILDIVQSGYRSGQLSA